MRWPISRSARAVIELMNVGNQLVALICGDCRDSATLQAMLASLRLDAEPPPNKTQPITTMNETSHRLDCGGLCRDCLSRRGGWLAPSSTVDSHHVAHPSSRSRTRGSLKMRLSERKKND
jgi:hypothetical protein